jgi:hypothetical protein
MLTQEKLKALFSYNARTGVFKNKTKRGSRAMPGDEAGSLMRSGYVEITVLGVRTYAHRLAWFYVHGVWPLQVDHVNGVRSDNRIKNLRAASAADNAQNLCKRTRNTSGYTGAFKHRGRWRAQIKCGNVQHFLGVFDTPLEAHNAYKTAKKQLHKFQPQLTR